MKVNLGDDFVDVTEGKRFIISCSSANDYKSACGPEQKRHDKMLFYTENYFLQVGFRFSSLQA